MNLIQRFRAKTPKKNRSIGQIVSGITAALAAIETTLIMYDIKVPQIVHNTLIGFTILGVVIAAYNGQKVRK